MSKLIRHKLKVENVQLATLVSKAPEGEEWLHEMKFDGYRILCVIDKDIRLITRGQQDWTDKFISIQNAVQKLKLQNTILDGEIVVLDKNGLPNFQLLQNAINEGETSFVYYVFDLIFYKGKDLTHHPLEERKEILKAILPKKSNIIRFSSHIKGKGKEVFDEACRLGFEGIVSKESQSHYTQKRTRSWLKVKCTHRQEFVIGGFTEPKGSREYFGALLLGYYKNKHFQYCGRVGTGFNTQTLKILYSLLLKNKSKQCPYSSALHINDLQNWVKPNIIVEIEFKEWTHDGVLRHPSFKGIRQDKNPKNVKKEG